jgi:transposase
MVAACWRISIDCRVEVLLEGAPELGSIVRPLVDIWRRMRVQIVVFDEAVQRQIRADPICHLLMTVPGIGALFSEG